MFQQVDREPLEGPSERRTVHSADEPADRHPLTHTHDSAPSLMRTSLTHTRFLAERSFVGP